MIFTHEDFVKIIQQKQGETHPSFMLNGFELRAVPDQIGIVENLQWLMLDDNRLKDLPTSVSRLKRLTLLSLSGNNISAVPACVFELENLVSLDLSRNNITSLPREVGNLTNLKRLDVSGNQLKNLPEEIAQMSSLEELIVSRNSLSELPATIAGARHLNVIDVTGNQITNLPTQIALLDELKSLVLKGNPLVSPPVEVISQGTKAVSAFLRNLQESGTRRFEAKLLILGEGSVGKSSLLRRFKGEDFEAGLFTTHGIDVAALPMRHPDYVDEKIQINVWDFAGQEIEHATHQFFMSDSSVYLLVWNARGGPTQGKLNYWLERIKSHAPRSPILLVATHTDERSPDVDFAYYQAAYPQLKEESHVDNKNGIGPPALQAVIARHASKLPHMGQHWPSSWQRVEDELKLINDHHITFGQFKEICQASGIKTTTDIESLSETLHRLGIILHFKDDVALRDLVVLKPNWITKAISLALSDKQIADAFGCLHHNQLKRIWSNYDSSLYSPFFSLMNKFELCYQMENSINTSLIPALLPYKSPPRQIKPTLQMVFKLSSVPAGIMSRFIVRTHRFTTNVHWRGGALLEHDGQIARAELFDDRLEFVISADGSYPTYFFSVLVDTVEQILSDYPGLTIEKMISCTCSGIGRSDEWCGHYFTYSELNNYFSKGEKLIDCRKTVRKVNVLSLLYGIHDASRGMVSTDLKEVVAEKRNSETYIAFPEQQRQIVLLAQRGVTDYLNKVDNADISCPNVFMLSRENGDIGVNLVCQCEDGWHLSSATSVIKLGNNLKTRSDFVPLMAEYDGLLDSIIPLAGINVSLKSQVNDTAYQSHKNNTRFMREIIASFSNDAGRIGGLQRATISLHKALQATYEQHGYTGLKQTTTPDGNKVWLCPYHYAQLQPSPLQIMQKKFDTFLCHNSQDKDFVRELYAVLGSHGIKCWLDEEEILGGDRWQDSMATGLQESKCTIVCIGPHDWGSWQYEELQVALNQSVSKDSSHIVIPLLIPPITSLPATVPAFLRLRHSLRISSLDNEIELKKVIKSIRRDGAI